MSRRERELWDVAFYAMLTGGLSLILLAAITAPDRAAAQSFGSSRTLEIAHLLGQVAITNSGHRCDAVSNMRPLPDGERFILDCMNGGSFVAKMEPDPKPQFRQFKYRFEYLGRCEEVVGADLCR